MSLSTNGRAAIRAMLDSPERFAKVKDGDFAAAAVKLARKQITAAGQTCDDLNSLKSLLGPPTFEGALDTLTAFQAKQLARRIDPNVQDTSIASCNMALMHVRKLLVGTIEQTQPVPEAEAPAPVNSVEAAAVPSDAPPKANKYLGRKAFRTGR